VETSALKTGTKAANSKNLNLKNLEITNPGTKKVNTNPETSAMLENPNETKARAKSKIENQYFSKTVTA